MIKHIVRTGVVMLMANIWASAAEEAFNIESFEDKRVPAWIKSVGASKLNFSDERSQHGEQSLLWSWNKPGGLVLDAKKYNAEVNPTDFLVWVYSEKSQGALDISWGQGQQVRFELNFTGWRSLWIRLNFDGLTKEQRDSDKDYYAVNGFGQGTEIPPAVKVGQIRIQPTGDAGRLYVDLLELTNEAIPHDRIGNLQMPFIVNDPGCRHNYPWVAMQYERVEALPEASAENLEHYERIKKSIQSIIKPGALGNLGKATRAYAELQKKIAIEGDSVRGPHISSHIVERYYRQKGFEGIHQRTMQGALHYVADQFRITGDDKWKELYFKYLDFQHEKGFSAGSGMMNLVFVAKLGGDYASSLMIMRPYFDEARWEREAATLRWIAGYNNLYNPVKQAVDADKVLGDLQTLLTAIYLQPDETDEQKMGKLYDYIQLSKILKVTMEPGIPKEAEGFRIVRPDYSIYHHGQEMIFSYGYPAGVNYTKFAYIFREGPARLDMDLVEGLVDLYPRFLTPMGNGPITGTRGLSPGTIGGYIKMLDYAAAADCDAAKAWLKYFHLIGSISDRQIDLVDLHGLIKDESVPSMEALSGNWIQPYAAMQVHRRDDWIAVIRGVNQSTPSPEMFGDPNAENCANVFGDQQGQGFLQLIGNGGVSESGINLLVGGWDWAMYPGATTLRLSHDKLKKMTGGKVRPKHRTLSGGLSHFNRDGLFHQRLFANDGSGLDGIDGHKSWFFFDDLIVCLGSGLKSPPADVPMVTTLFQFGSRNEDEQGKMYLMKADSSVRSIGSAMEEESMGQGAISLMDPSGHVYYVPKQDRVMIKRGIQHSQNHRSGFAPTKGYYSIAWLDHGIRPEDAGYEYSIKLFGGEGALKQFEANKFYNVLQKDNQAHIVYYTPKKTYGYVLLEPLKGNAHGPILETDQPVLIMATKSRDGLEITISDPDPAVDAPERSITHQVVVKGEWNIVTATSADAVFESRIEGGSTYLSVTVKDGCPVDLMLNK
jgi:chondroitin-sulfate-ABC endolyase/exolyase